MRVVVTAEVRFSQTPDNAVWTADGHGYDFWTRYLTAFDQVRVVARVCPVAQRGPDAVRVDGEQVEVWPLPYYVGARQYLAARRAVGRALRAAAAETDAVILRVPSPIGTLLADARQARRLPYGLEVIGDPYDVFAPGALTHPLRPLLRHWLTQRLRRQCGTADAVAYVTQGSLQARYPSRPDALNSAYSSIDLSANAFVTAPRPAAPPQQPAALISVGSLAQRYKGIDILIRALARLVSLGIPVRLTHLGDGRFRPELERLARHLDVADLVEFPGVVPSGAAVRRHLDAADVFVMPSRTEGLPKALIEAMARGLPAIGSAVGGIPELLPAGQLVPPNDPVALAGAIARLVCDPARMATASAGNLDRAREFAAQHLRPRRTAFYQQLRDITQRSSPDRSPEPISTGPISGPYGSGEPATPDPTHPRQAAARPTTPR